MSDLVKTSSINSLVSNSISRFGRKLPNRKYEDKKLETNEMSRELQTYITAVDRDIRNIIDYANRISSTFSSTETDPIVKAINGIIKSNGTTIGAAVSGTDIKTVNSTSLLGSGNVAVQPTLVSGTNIKTINSTTLLGSGNFTLVAIETDPIVGAITGIVKANGAGVISAASEGTDYLAPSRIDDTKGNGDTTYVWSADKIFDQLALKDSVLTFVSPLLRTTNSIALNGLTGFGLAGQVIKTNATADSLEWGTADCDVIHTNITPVGNVGSGEDILMTYTLPANTLDTNGEFLEITVWGTTGESADTAFKLYFGATVIQTISVGFGNEWFFNAKVVRTAAATQTAMIGGGGNSDYTNIQKPTETLSNTVVIKCTGEATDNNDIIQEGMIIKWYASAL